MWCLYTIIQNETHFKDLVFVFFTTKHLLSSSFFISKKRSSFFNLGYLVFWSSTSMEIRRTEEALLCCLAFFSFLASVSALLSSKGVNFEGKFDFTLADLQFWSKNIFFFFFTDFIISLQCKLWSTLKLLWRILMVFLINGIQTRSIRVAGQWLHVHPII